MLPDFPYVYSKNAKLRISIINKYWKPPNSPLRKQLGGRDPNNKFTPRTLDLDIIIWNDFEGFIDGYELPDPDINKYEYIQKPLAEIKL